MKSILKQILLNQEFQPTDVAGCTLWLDASRITDLADGAAVAQWNDLSGNGNNVSQATGVNQPTYKVSIINGKPVVRFNGSAQYLVGNHVAVTSDITVFVVACRTSTGSYPELAQDGQTTGNYGWQLSYDSANGYKMQFGVRVAGQPWGGNLQATASGDTNWHVFTGGRSGITTFIDQDGTVYSNSTGVAGSIDYGTGPQLGVGSSGASLYFPGDMAELILYNRLLNAGERQQVRSYFGSKYGITVV